MADPAQVETLINTVECQERPQIIRFTTITIGVNLGGTMNLVMLKNAEGIDPGDPVGVKKALVEAEEVVVVEGWKIPTLEDQSSLIVIWMPQETTTNSKIIKHFLFKDFLILN